jgi:hypothetical protein
VTKASWGALSAVGLVALGLRLVGLDHLPGINGDEGVYAVHARSFLQGEPLSSLRTGTNLPMNPAFFGVAVLLHALLPQTLLTLRLAALVHSLLVIALAWLLFRKRGAQFAAVLACLVAVLPIHLGYARLAWDATAVPTVTALALAAATRLRPVLTLLSFALCLWVHPVTVFAAPILLAPFVVARWPRTPEGRFRVPSRRALALGAVALALLAATPFVLLDASVLPEPIAIALQGLPDRVWSRLASPIEAVTFARLYADLIAGPTAYRYMTGSMPDLAAWLHVLGFGLAALLVLHTAWRTRHDRSRAIDRAVLLALLASLALTYLLGGLRIVLPHTERYAMFLTVPSCYVLAACADAIASTQERAARVRLGVAALGAALLLSFQVGFFDALQRPDPGRANAFRTGDVDPKAQAFAAIQQGRARDKTTVVLVEDWWIYWPVRYLAGPEPIAITIAGMPPDYRFPRDFQVRPVSPERLELFAIAWAASAFDQSLSHRSLEHVDILGYEPGPILRVHRVKAVP